MSAFITSIGTASPKHRLKQSEIADFMAINLKLDENQRRELQVLYRATGIQERYTVLEDYTRSIGSFEFFPNSEQLEPFPTVSKRLEVFKKEALPLSITAIKNCLGTADPGELTHLITVSCTGMYAPGIDIELTHSLGLSPSIRRTSINFMGCYAAINALKVAAQACLADRNAKVLVVCVELCSLHFQKYNTEDNILANALFGDGAAAVLVEGEANGPRPLSMEAFHCTLAPNGHKDMAWSIGDLGFEMALSSYVPEIIKNGIGDLTRELLSQIDKDLMEIEYYAIHPGGKKILDAIEEELSIDLSLIHI